MIPAALEIRPARLQGALQAPPSKSIAHRMLICAALAQGRSRIRNVSKSEDLLATLDCIRALGAEAERQGDTLLITGCGGKVSPGASYPCRESGSTLRFLMPLSLLSGGSSSFTGSPRLFRRSSGVYESLFSSMGIVAEQGPDAVRLTGQLRAGDYAIPGNISSQFATGLLLSLPLCDGDSILTILPPVESRSYIDITLSVLAAFGVTVRETAPNRFEIPGGQCFSPADLTVEGDWSNGAALLAFGALGMDVLVTGLSRGSVQGDRAAAEYIRRLEEPLPLIDLSDQPDLGPVLFALAAAKHGGRFTGTARLKIKESDRCAAMAEELSKFGVPVTVEENAVTVRPAALRSPDIPLSGHNDHRIVMALTLLCTLTGGTVIGAEAVAKSYPDFFEDYRSLGGIAVPI